MAVSLYDMMRPVAIAAGLGVGCAGQRGLSLFASALAGLVVGVGAFIIVGRLANLWLRRQADRLVSSDVDSTSAGSASEGAFAVVYVTVFVLLMLAATAGCYLGRWALSARAF